MGQPGPVRRVREALSKRADGVDLAGTTPVLWDERELPQDTPERTWQFVAHVEDRQQGWALQMLLERRLEAEQADG